MHIYNSLKNVPQQYKKTILAGRLKGMSDIKPQWRILKLTEMFGACGIGWRIQNLKFEYEKATDEEIVCNCHLDFSYKINDVWSEPIPATGGSKLLTKEKHGLYVSDEVEKMAYTDAISVATKMIGLAGEVYIGHDGKYGDKPENPSNNQANNNDLQWLNVIDKDKNFTKEWLNIKDGITNNKIKSIIDVRKHYKVSKQVEEKITELLKQTI